MKIFGAAPLALSMPAKLHAKDLVQTHGLSFFGDLKYPADFKHFDYVNPNAPVGGIFQHVPGTLLFNQNFATFNSMNSFILRGDAPLQMEVTFASLMTRALDESDALYGLAAKSVLHNAKRKYFQFHLQKDARFHDGSPLRAADVVFSLLTLKKNGHPLIAGMLADIQDVKAEAVDIVGVQLRESASRDVILAVAEAPIFSQAYYDKRDFTASTMDPPLGSGPFKVGRFELGHFIEYERVADWWGWRLAAMRGQYNWKRLRVDYYHDRDVAFEAFKAGDILFREEFTSRLWAMAYDFPAIRDGRVKKMEVPDGLPSGMQGFFINMRRGKFKDARIRRAINLAFDFEWSNSNLFYGQYLRSQSVFQNSPMMAQGVPDAAELTLLETFRNQLPQEAFGYALLQPISDGSGSDRNLLKAASDLLREAGVKLKNGQAMLASGERLSVEFLDFDPALERVVLPYIKNLKSLGIDASWRLVDPAQYQSRSSAYDFDITSRRFVLQSTPGESLRRLFSSQDADQPGSYNLSGLKSPVVDALIKRAVEATDRKSLMLTCRVLDRVLRSMHFWVPQWYKASHTLAYWDIYESPAIKPPYALGAFETWWVNQQKAQKLSKGL